MMNLLNLSQNINMLPLAFFLHLMLLPPYANAMPFDERYWNCSSTCGGSDITFPFWEIGGEAEYCGPPGYGLECDEDHLILKIGDQRYKILDITKEKQRLTVVRMDILQDNCPKPSSPFTLDHRFNFADDDLNATLLSDCSLQEQYPSLHQLSCPQGGDHFLYLTQPPDFLPPNCQTNLMIPMLRSAAQDLTSNITDAAEALERGFEVNWTLNTTQCLACLDSAGACRYSSLGGFYCFCFDGDHQGTCHEPQPQPVPKPQPREAPSRRSGWKAKLGIAAGAIGGTAIVMLAAFFLITRLWGFMFWKEQPEHHQAIEDFIRNYGSLAPKRFKYSEVKRMTNSFREKLGQGGFGAVYKGNLPDGTLVAVKLLHEFKGNGEDFINEVASISRTSHVNIVTLLGFCFEGHRRALVYEFMSMQSLDKFICDENPETTRLGWDKLHQIAVGIARGLEYLHRGCNTRILHFDIKPQNILLDDDFCPKISDFGLSKLCLKKESILSTLTTRGTIGYIAPEVFSRNFGGVSHKSDVYSYGMMLIDMVGGRQKKLEEGGEGDRSSQMYFPDRVCRRLEQHNVFGLHDQITPEENEIARKMIAVGVWCIQAVPSERPSMTRVIELLEGSIEAMQMPPKPALFSAPRSSPLQDYFSTSESQ